MNQPNIDYKAIGEILANYRRSKRVHRDQLCIPFNLLEDGAFRWSESEMKRAILDYVSNIEELATAQA
jgi:hypothetical protein